MRNSSDFLVNHGMSSLTSFSGLFSGALRSTDTTVPYKDISTCHDANVSPRVTACHRVLYACIVCLATFSLYFLIRGVCYFRSVVVFVYSNNFVLKSGNWVPTPNSEFEVEMTTIGFDSNGLHHYTCRLWHTELPRCVII